MKNGIKYLFRKIETFFLWASGACLPVLQQVPIEKNKFLGIGGTIIFTALMACIAGGYAFYTAFKTVWLACIFGLFWGSLIFNLDRFIVSTFGSGDGKKTISRQELIEASPRLLMAILLGFVISTPLEIKIFEKEIKLKIDVLKARKKQELIREDSTFNSEHALIRQQVAALKNETDSLTRNKTLLIDNSVDYLRKRRIELENDRNSQQKMVDAAKAALDSDRNALALAQKDTTGTISGSTLNTLTEKVRKSNNWHKEEIRKRTEIEHSIESLSKNQQQTLENEQQRLESSINSNNALLVGLRQRLDEKDRTSDANQTNYEKIAREYDGFAAHLEGLDLLTEDRPIIFYVKWLITLLFIFIEVAPILFKMMTERGPYDDIMDYMRYEQRVRQLEKQSNLNQEINVAVKIHIDKYEQKLIEELKSNKEVLASIAKAQQEIAIQAIEAWKEEQKARIRENGSSTLTTTTNR